MLFLKYLLLAGAIALFAVALGLAITVVYSFAQRRRKPEGETDETLSEPEKSTLVSAARLGGIGFVVLLLAFSIVVVPSGMAGVRVSQISGTLPGTLYPGTHFVLPLVQYVEM